ncbi:MAG: cytochrome P450 [Deltaproteobacteria bacterium]|nr:cytochrome P450 [Deltaproteobacteria bacterium]
MPEIPVEYPEIDFATDAVPNLHEILRDLRERHAVAPVRYHGATAYLITRFGDLRSAMADDESFPSWAAYARHTEPVMGRTIQCMGGDEHRRNRGLVSAAFRPRLMTEFVEAFLTPVAHQLVDAILEGQSGPCGTADLVSSYTTRYAFTVITRLLDFPPTDFERLKRWGDGLIDFPWDPEGAQRSSAEFTEYLKPLIDDRRANPGEDLLSSLATVEIEGERLSEEEIFSFLRLLFPAGADTTYRGLGSMFYAVLTHREVWESIKADPDRIPAVVQESLRWEGPTAMLPRFAPKDVKWAGVDIPGGSEVIFGITSANRDREIFDAPDRFDPDRKEREFLSFGHGAHFCLGSHLARREMEVSLRVLSERLPDMVFAEDADPAIQGTVLRGPKTLPVEFGLP